MTDQAQFAARALIAAVGKTEAAYILRAVELFPELVAALKELRPAGDRRFARLLAQAEGALERQPYQPNPNTEL